MRVCVEVSDLGIIDDCEMACGCWDLTPGPLEEQSVSSVAEPSSSDLWEFCPHAKHEQQRGALLVNILLEATLNATGYWPGPSALSHFRSPHGAD